jgi:hypothetical protein
MTFKENLLAKMEIDRMVQKIRASIGPVDSGLKIDKETLRLLLEKSRYTVRKERDLELYIRETGEGKTRILVLDNELPMYSTTVEDVLLRRSPTIKEMLSIRKAIKILNDSDVLISKKEATLKTLRDECTGLLDLTFDLSDIEKIEKEAVAFLGKGYIEGIVESLSLYAELLGFQEIPKKFRLAHHEILGKTQLDGKGQNSLGPLVIYNNIDNSLKYVETGITGSDKQILDRLVAISQGTEKACLEGSNVFGYLTRAVDLDVSLAPESKTVL